MYQQWEKGRMAACALPLICTRLTSGALGELPGFATPFSPVPFAILWSVKASSSMRVTLCPCLHGHHCLDKMAALHVNCCLQRIGPTYSMGGRPASTTGFQHAGEQTAPCQQRELFLSQQACASISLQAAAARSHFACA